MKILKNNSKQECRIKYKGVFYSIPANGDAVLEDAVALHWKGNIHQFLSLREAPESTLSQAGTKEDEEEFEAEESESLPENEESEEDEEDEPEDKEVFEPRKEIVEDEEEEE